MADARANFVTIMIQNRQRKEKIFQQQQELLEKERAKEEAKRKLPQQASSITELGGSWKSEKEIKDDLPSQPNSVHDGSAATKLASKTFVPLSAAVSARVEKVVSKIPKKKQ